MRTRLLIALVSAAVISAVAASLSAGQSSTITARGKIDDGFVAFVVSQTLGGEESAHVSTNAVDLSFPEDGGDVTGRLTVMGASVYKGCRVATVIRGSFHGSYSAERASLSGQIFVRTMRTASGSGCAKLKTRSTDDRGTATFEATVEGSQLTGKLKGDSKDDVAFTANLSGGTGGADQDLVETLQGGSYKDVNAYLAQRSDCAPPDSNESTGPLCKAALDYGINLGRQFRAKFPGAVDDLAQRNEDVISGAGYLAAVRDRNGNPVFPSVRAALPVLARLVVNSERERVGSRQISWNRAATRLLALLIRFDRDEAARK